MNPEKTKKLCDKYPDLYQKDFWFECDDGWYDLIDTLSSCIQQEVKTRMFNASTEEEREQCRVVAVQVKSKFAGLRFYANFDSPEISGMIRHAESMSYRICEACGNKASSKKSSRGWLFTMCDTCWEDAQQKLG